ncbi:uncharacterized protein BP5553_07456 [Venustampulla echinocandica]|uniref:AAA+ ATPase domain-containing protein n=1 Tax=Venustampulla echinocandica TaxID=2656787 RepID=A0A370TGL0_9HELO|nr:uncharacterized protein BP5553_07456 [Venustampulla echinocandica]RDL34328.1 hypothetical protein BP5553_07456 [Venustampulla echinocandica]
MRCFSRQIPELSIPYFEGSRRIKGLPLYPFEIYGNEEARELVRNELIARGQRWCQLLSDKSSYWMHEGLYIQYVQVDGYFAGRYESSRIGHRSGRLIIDSGKELPVWLTFSTETVESKNQVSDQQALFCPNEVICFDPQNLKYEVVALSDLYPIQWNKLAFGQLVLDDKKKTIIRSLLQKHSEEFPAGLVIVLHGPPGVGKTLTAESVAEFTEKPLIVLRVSSLLTDGGDFSGSISEFLGYADRLGAIILLDEADAILESRSYEDIKRNGMVSGTFYSEVFLNRRQIRNAMKLAQSLAIQESREMNGERPRDPIMMAPLNAAHVRQAVQVTQGLPHYFSRPKKDEEKLLGR